MKYYVIFILIIYSVILNRFNKHRDTYNDVHTTIWPTLTPKFLVASQIEQESLWKQYATLRTSREYGFGFGQLTIAKNRKGEIRFNKFAEAKRKYKELQQWAWKDRFNPKMQIMFIFKEDKFLYKKFEKKSYDHTTNLALMLSAYNGGSYYLYKEIEKCRKDPACNHMIWYGNIETKAARSTKKYKGYGKSFFDINREYVKTIMYKRINKYKEVKNVR